MMSYWYPERIKRTFYKPNFQHEQAKLVGIHNTVSRSLFGKVLWQNIPNEHPTVVLFAFAIYFHPAGCSCTTDLCVAVIELFGAFWGQKRTVKLVSLAGARWGFVPAAFVPGGEITVNCFERSERGKGSTSCGCLPLGTWSLTFSAV